MMKNAFIEAGRVGEIENGAMKEVIVDGRHILLARIGEVYYATDNRCTHAGGKLSEGKLEGTVVTCPRHGSQFDLKDGSVVRWMSGSGMISAVGRALKKPVSIKKYDVKVDGDKVFVEA
ncbi:MAG: Rieske 2Fe-2S domain-containing protein [Dehalococcoidales bacterium]|nr:MAG: Rieske 2Fe-2S domain-containing protein [Dehalococcoidales bacterium]